jgi:hypothetical protein
VSVNSSDALEQRPQQAPADEEHEHEGERRLGQCERERTAQRHRAGGGQHRNDDDERHRGDVLEHRHRHAQPGMARMFFALLGELLADDGGRGLREHRADDEGRRRREPGPPGDEADRSGGERHLRRAQPENQVAQGVDLRQREVQADREQQEHDAELGDRLDRRRVDHRASGVRTEQHPHQQVAEAGRDAQALEQQHHGHGHAEQQQDLDEGLVEGHGRR